MKDYVYIQSTTSIVVSAGLQAEDVTNPDAHVGDRLRVNPYWPKMTILIKQGRHTYPSFIKNWESVKDLVKDNILTIGEEVDDIEDDEMKKVAKEVKDEIESFNKKKVKDISLDKLAKE